MPTLGKLIRRRRLELGMTQEDLAEAVGTGVRQAEISRLENDRVQLPRRERLERLAAALDVPMGELLARSGWAEAEQALAAAPPMLTLLEPPEPPTLLEKLEQIEMLVAEVRAEFELNEGVVDERAAPAGLRPVD